MTEAENITEQLFELHFGDASVIPRLLPQIRAELRRIAQAYFNREGSARSIDPSDLVQETTLRLLKPGAGPWKDREHFYAFAAINIRQLLVSRARARKARKRGGGSLQRVPLEGVAAMREEDACQVLDVHRALRHLNALDKRQARIVVFRVFGGMTVKETAKALGIGRTTVKEDWDVATAFLRRELKSYRDTPSMGTN